MKDGMTVRKWKDEKKEKRWTERKRNVRRWKK